VWIVRFLLRRLLVLVPLLVGVLLFTFVLVRLGGQDPVALLAGPSATAQEIAGIRAQFGLDLPIWDQFAVYFGLVLRGDLGHSWLTGRPILADILERIPATLELLLLGIGLGAAIGIPLGMLSAARHGTRLDAITRVLSLVGFSIPTYFLGLLMLLVFFYALDVAPPGMGRISLMYTPPPAITGSYTLDGLIAGDWRAARSAASQLVLPVICAAIVCSAPIIKQTRAIALGVLGSDFVRYARACGLADTNINRIALRNSFVPVATFTGSELVGLVGTVSLIEYVFAWGGLGQYGLTAITRGDFSAVQGYVLTLALFSIVVFLVVDLLVLAFEPRARQRA
jgi:ABC-type dipeptide/oligopeptide/nickel transport system permease component